VAFLIVLFVAALSLCVVGLAAISVWWSWLFIAAMLAMRGRGHFNDK
jgi:hypothetical protein